MIYQWRKKLREDGDRVESLIPKFTSPKYPRRSMVPYEVIEFGKDLREKQPRLGKEKIKPLLDRYSEERGFSGISVSTIGSRNPVGYLIENHLMSQMSLTHTYS